MSNDEQGQQGDQGSAPVLEWALAAVGVAVAAAVLGYLAFVAVTSPSTPTNLRPEVIRTLEQDGEYLVRIRVQNAGGTPAAAVVVEGQLYDDGAAIQTSHVTIDYVPSDGASEAGLVFTVPPEDVDLELRVLGYRTP